MSDEQEGRLSYIQSKWREEGYAEFERYPADDSDDVLLVATAPDREPHAARVNSAGKARVGPVEKPELAQPLTEAVRT